MSSHICSAHDVHALPIMYSDQAPISREFVLNIEQGFAQVRLRVSALVERSGVCQRCSTREFLININQLNGAPIDINFYQLNSSRELSISTQLELF